MKYAIVDNKFTVINIVKWDGKTKWKPPFGTTAIQSDIAEIGDMFDPINERFIPDKSRGLILESQ